MVGTRFNEFRDDGYKESGASIQNLTVSKKYSRSLEALLGARISKSIYINGKTIRPELQGFVNYNIHSKSPIMEVKIDGLITPLEFNSQKSSKAWYMVNTGVSIINNNMEYGALYEIQLDKKYISHQGMLKLRANF